MTLFQIICFSFATIALTVNIIIIMIQVLKQRNSLFNILLKIAELEQKLESRLPLAPTVTPQESIPKETQSVKVDLPQKESSYFYMTSTTTTPVDPKPQISEAPAEPTTANTKSDKPYGITYKVVSQAEKMVRDVEETVEMTGVSKNKIYSVFSISMNRNRTWFNTMVKSWLETEPKRSPKVLDNVIETRKRLRQYLKQLKLETINVLGIVLHERISIGLNPYEIRELSTKQYESIKAIGASPLFILLDQKLNLAYSSWNNGQPELVQLPEARIFDSKALDTILKSLEEEGIRLRIALLVPKK